MQGRESEEEQREKATESEEQRWKRETVMEERRRRDERDHEMPLFQMLGQMISPRERAQDNYDEYSTFSTPHTHYDYDTY